MRRLGDAAVLVALLGLFWLAVLRASGPPVVTPAAVRGQIADLGALPPPARLIWDYRTGPPLLSPSGRDYCTHGLQLYLSNAAGGADPTQATADRYRCRRGGVTCICRRRHG